MYISRHVIKMHIFGQLFIIGNIAIVPSSYKVFHKDVESIVVFLSLQTFSVTLYFFFQVSLGLYCVYTMFPAVTAATFQTTVSKTG